MSSVDGPNGEPPAEPLRSRQEPTEHPPPPEPDPEKTGIIRRTPTGPIPQPLSDDTRTSIIRRAPAGLDGTDEPPTGIIRQPPRRIAGSPQTPPSTTAVAASAVSIVSGWATAVVATDLMTAWWHSDRLFCLGLGFLAAVFAASTIAGVVGILLRRRVGVYLTLVAAVLALLIFVGIFVAGAQLAGVVRAIPVLPVATIALAVAPATWRWTK